MIKSLRQGQLKRWSKCSKAQTESPNSLCSFECLDYVSCDETSLMNACAVRSSLCCEIDCADFKKPTMLLRWLCWMHFTNFV